MKRLLGFTRSLIRWLTPRFVTEDWACQLYWDDELDCWGADPFMSMEYVKPGDTFDGICTLKHFTWLGMAFGRGQDTEMRPWVNPHDGVAQ